MVAVVFLEALRQVLLGHAHAGGVNIANVERDQLAAVVILGYVPDLCRAVEAMQGAECH
jgi:hypothetical protein